MAWKPEHGHGGRLSIAADSDAGGVFCNIAHDEQLLMALFRAEGEPVPDVSNIDTPDSPTRRHNINA